MKNVKYLSENERKTFRKKYGNLTNFSAQSNYFNLFIVFFHNLKTDSDKKSACSDICAATKRAPEPFKCSFKTITYTVKKENENKKKDLNFIFLGSYCS